MNTPEKNLKPVFTEEILVFGVNTRCRGLLSVSRFMRDMGALS